jgi:hypothetical protein
MWTKGLRQGVGMSQPPSSRKGENAVVCLTIRDHANRMWRGGAGNHLASQLNLQQKPAGLRFRRNIDLIHERRIIVAASGAVDAS